MARNSTCWSMVARIIWLLNSSILQLIHPAMRYKLYLGSSVAAYVNVQLLGTTSLTNALLQAVLNQTGYFIGSYMLRPEIGAGGNRFDISKLETRYNVPLAYILAGLGFFLVSYWTVFLRCDRLLHYSTLTFTVECARQRTTTC